MSHRIAEAKFGIRLTRHSNLCLAKEGTAETGPKPSDVLYLRTVARKHAGSVHVDGQIHFAQGMDEAL